MGKILNDMSTTFCIVYMLTIGDGGNLQWYEYNILYGVYVYYFI